MQDKIEINGVTYIREEPIDESKYVIVRCRGAGVHAGYLHTRNSEVLVLKNSRRLWRWWSKFTLSGLATEGVLAGKENECRFACVLPVLDLTVSDVCEVIYCSEKARRSIKGITEFTNE